MIDSIINKIIPCIVFLCFTFLALFHWFVWVRLAAKFSKELIALLDPEISDTNLCLLDPIRFSVKKVKKIIQGNPDLRDDAEQKKVIDLVDVYHKTLVIILPLVALMLAIVAILQ